MLFKIEVTISFYILNVLNMLMFERLIYLIEERLSFAEPEKQCFHLCIVNLVIGTLYCAKGNFEFGISRIIKSLDPYDKKLHTDTWWFLVFNIAFT